MSANARLAAERPEKETRQVISTNSSSVHNEARLALKFRDAGPRRHERQPTFGVRKQPCHLRGRFSIVGAGRAVLTTDRNCDDILVNEKCVSKINLPRRPFGKIAHTRGPAPCISVVRYGAYAH